MGFERRKADTSELETLSRQLEVETAKCHAVIASAPEAIVVADDKCRITFANSVAEKLYARPVPYGEEVASHGDLQLCYPNGTPYDPMDLPLSRSVFYGETHTEVEMAVIWPDGQKRELLVNTAPIRDSQGEVAGAIGVFQDITERQAQEAALRKARDELEAQVKARTSMLEEAKAKLQAEIAERKRTEEQLRSLASELVLTEQRERRQLGVDLHDTLAQALALSKLKVQMLRTKVSSPDFASDLEEIRELIEQSIQHTRSVMDELSPSALYEYGLESALEDLCRETGSLHGIKVAFEDDRQAKPLDENLRILLFRAVRELLINVVKHARAQTVKIAICRENGRIRITIEDDGIGCDLQQMNSCLEKKGGFGLFSVKERLYNLGGCFDIVSSPGAGTRVSLAAPLEGERLLDCSEIPPS